MKALNQFIEQTAAWIHQNEFDVELTFAFVLLGCSLLLVAAIWSFLCRRDWVKQTLHASSFRTGSIWHRHANGFLTWRDRFGPAASAPMFAVKSPARTYQLLSTVGTGDLCDIFRAESEGQLYVLKAPRVPGCDSLLAKEQFVLRQLHEHSLGNSYSRYLPEPIEAFRWENRSYFSFAWRAGFVTATEILRQYPGGLDGRRVAWMFNRTLEVLGFAHQHGWIHGAVLPPHLLFDPQSHGLQLLGWTHAEACGQPLRFGSRSFQTWYPPECLRRDPARAATDIYQAARSMLWLASGDPRSTTMPKHIPTEMARLFQKCLEDSPSRRPQDAWLLHEEFNALLEVVYGPPQFCPLTITYPKGENDGYHTLV